MIKNYSLTKKKVGKLRIATLVVGLLSLCLMSYDFAETCIQRDAPWRLLLIVTVITLIVSSTWVVLFILGVIINSNRARITDWIYHILGGLLLILGSIIWSLEYYSNSTYFYTLYPCSLLNRILIIASGGFGIVNGFLHLTVAFFVRRHQKELKARKVNILHPN